MRNAIQRWTEYGLIALLFLLPWQTRYFFVQGELAGGFFEYHSIAFYLLDIVFLFVLTLFLISFKREQARWSRWEMIVWILLAVIDAAMLVSLLVTDNIVSSAYWYIRFVQAAVLLFIFSKAVYRIRPIIYACILAGFIQVVFAIHQVMTGRVFESTLLGMASQQASDLGVSVVALHGERLLRAYGSFPHPNMLGGFLVVCLLLSLHPIIKKTWMKYIQAFLAAGLVLTFSRSAWLSLLVGLGVIFVLSKEKRMSIRRMIPIGVGIVVTFVLLSSFVMQRFSADERLESISISERAQQYEQAGILLSQFPLTGVGLRQFPHGVYTFIDNQQSVWAYQPVHNVYVLVAVEIGIISGIAFVSLLFMVILQGIHQKRFHIAILISLCVIALFDHYLWTTISGLWLLFIVIGMNLVSSPQHLIKSRNSRIV